MNHHFDQIQITDTHCHLDFDCFNPDRAQIIEQCQHDGITRIVVPGVTAQRWPRQLQLCRQYQALYPAVGLHPYFLSEHHPDDLDTLQQTLQQHPEITAIGEIGLDYQLDLPRKPQLQWLHRQLEIAEQFKLPVLLHVRKAHDEMIKALKQHHINQGIAHAFNGSLQQAHQYINLGFKLGFGGMLTYPRSRRLHRLAQNIPLEHIVLETDAPDMTGVRHQGQRNSPCYIIETLQMLADLRKTSIETIANVTWDNSSFLLPDS